MLSTPTPDVSTGPLLDAGSGKAGGRSPASWCPHRRATSAGSAGTCSTEGYEGRLGVDSVVTQAAGAELLVVGHSHRCSREPPGAWPFPAMATGGTLTPAAAAVPA
jgi:hypothetical protein